MTFFLTTHYLEEAEACDRVAVLHRGELLACGTPADVRGTALSLEEAFLSLTGDEDPPVTRNDPRSIGQQGGRS